MTEVEQERDAVLFDIKCALQACDCADARFGPCSHDRLLEEVLYLVKAGMEQRRAEAP